MSLQKQSFWQSSILLVLLSVLSRQSASAQAPSTLLIDFEIKTHIDIIEDFDHTLIQQLKDLSLKHDFLIFEDRKFADIGMWLRHLLQVCSERRNAGNTVALQYSSGIFKIASWSHITNAHTVPGPSIIQGLASVGLPLGRGLLLLAEMSTKGSLAVGPYTKETIRMARENREFVIGFIAQQRMDNIDLGEKPPCADEDFLVLTPGVGLDRKGDALGQQYRTPREVVLGSGCDVIIVGRGIYGRGHEFIKEEAERYRKEGWTAYLDRASSG
jgi:orotidine-5'-phosphate decarboxylase